MAGKLLGRNLACDVAEIAAPHMTNWGRTALAAARQYANSGSAADLQAMEDAVTLMYRHSLRDSSPGEADEAAMSCCSMINSPGRSSLAESAGKAVIMAMARIAGRAVRARLMAAEPSEPEAIKWGCEMGYWAATQYGSIGVARLTFSTQQEIDEDRVRAIYDSALKTMPTEWAEKAAAAAKEYASAWLAERERTRLLVIKIIEPATAA